MSEEKIAFKMKLHSGKLEEYRRRHDEIWPELVEALHEAKIRDYSIYYDDETRILFATMWRSKDHGLEALSKSELMRKWWAYMADIMETHPDNEPIATPLETVFHME
ncbi:MAG: L-rhamnose mutarotase [Rhizobiaceae bacterium]|nr:L-rhamnose mutarotase [Rhizobiaceae bacterium]